MKTLFFINGPMGAGKTTVCKKLLGRLGASAYLDGDWCWNINPFRVTDETKAMVLDNITAMLSRFLACPELDYIIFGWVMHQPETAQTILGRLDLCETDVRQYTLLCTGTTLQNRLEKDIRNGLRNSDVLKRSLDYLPLYDQQNTIKIITDVLSPDEIADQILHKEETS